MPNPPLLLFIELEEAVDGAMGVDALEVPCAEEEAAASVLEDGNKTE